MSRTVRQTLLLAFTVCACSEQPKPGVNRAYAALNEAPESAPEVSRVVAAHMAFREWADRYAQSPQTTSVDEGRALAATRRPLLAGLLLSDPRTALTMGLTTTERRALPSDVSQHLEQWRDGVGMLHVIGAVAGDTEQPPSTGVETFVTFNGLDAVLRAGVYGRRAAMKTREGLRLHGLELDGVIGLLDHPARRLSPADALLFDYQPGSPCPTSRKASTAAEVLSDGEHVVGYCSPVHADEYAALLLDQEQAGDETVASAWTEGAKTVLFMRVDFSDRAGDPVALTSAQTLINTNVNNFFAANSFNKTSMTTTVTPTLRMPRTAAQYQMNGGNYLQLMADARQAARDAGFDNATYNLDIVGHAGIFGGWAGRGYVGSKGTWLNGNFSQGVTSHELGHNYGVYHANFWSAGESIIGAGTQVEYGNPFDVMGNSSASHFNAWFKRIFDWVTAAQTQSVTASGTYRISALEVPAPAGAFQALRVPRNDSQNRSYWLEFRQGITNNPSLMSGVSINFGFPSMSSLGSHLLDLTPEGDRGASALVIGRTFSDPVSNVHLTPIGKGGTTPETIDVVVNLGPFPSNRPPTLTVAASQTSVPTNTPVTFTATATDPDGDPLAYAWFFDDGSFGANAASVTKTLTGARVFNVRCVVSDMKGGTAARAVQVTVGAPTTFVLSGTVTFSGQPLEGARVTDGTRSTFSLSDGTWALTNVPAGSFTVSASKFDLTLTRGFAAPLVVSASQSGLDFTAAPKPGYSISGRVLAGGAGVLGVTVSDGSRTATTNATGDFTLTNVPNGRSTLTATLAGWEFSLAGSVLNPVEVLGGNLTNVTFYASGQYISGSVPSSVTTAPVITDGYRTVTATRGSATQPWTFFLQSVPNGSWNLLANSPGVTLTPGNFTNPIVVAGTSRSNLSFQVAGTTPTFLVSGTVRTGGTPLPGVVVSDGTRSATTDSAGRYTLVGQPAGLATLTPTRAGYTFVPATRAVTVTTANLTAQDFDTTVANAPPTITTGPTATPTPTTGTTTQLAVDATDDGGESALTYSWTVQGGSWPVTFSANASNGAKRVTATFSGAGTYTFEVTVQDAGGLTVRRSTQVVVTQVATTMDVTPVTATVTTSGTQQFTAQLKDQFNRFMFVSTPTWMASGGGTVSASGLFTAGATPGGPFSVTATAGGRSGSATFTVVGSGAPTITQAARVTPSPVTGTTAALSVRASDDAGEPSLQYMWSATLSPEPVTFSVNGTNGAKDVTATFTRAGVYEFRVDVLDSAGNTVSSVVRVTVQATPTTLELQPRVVSLQVNETQAFTAVAQDQFGDPLSPQPAVTFSVSGGGAIDSAGVFTAGVTPGGPHTVTGAAGSISSTAAVTVGAAPDTQAPQVQLTAPVTGTTVTGRFTLLAQASDNVGVVKVEFFEGATKVGEATQAPWQLEVDSATLGVGSKSLTARASDAAGNVATSDAVLVTIGMLGPIDVLAPTVNIVSPVAGAETALTVTVTADASDDVGVSRVELELDGVQSFSATAAPYSTSQTVAAGSHTVVAIAFDASGKSTRSAAVTFTAKALATPEPMTPPVTPPVDEPVVEEAPPPGEVVVGGCGCNGAGVAPASLLGLALLATRAQRRRRVR